MSVFTTAREVVTRAANELGVISAGESLSADDAALLLQTLNLIVNQWNAVREAIYVSDFSTFTLTPSLNPHTIGPSSATWTVGERPVRIEAADLNIVGTPPASVVRNRICINDRRWWMDLSTPGITTAFPTDLYYAPDWPNGSIWFWPVPTTAYTVTLQLPVILTSTYTLATALSMPQGYDAALFLTLAEWCAVPMGANLQPKTNQLAAQARSVIFANNSEPVRLVTRDAGMPSGESRNRSTFNYYTGLPVTGSR